jgi:hypothetical protein
MQKVEQKDQGQINALPFVQPTRNNHNTPVALFILFIAIIF